MSQHKSNGYSLRTYVTGYLLSISLTLIAYLVVVKRSLSNTILIGVIIVLALIQFLVQMFFFLHLGKETRPRWKLFVMLLMIMVVLILVIGSLWIMANLNYRMTPQEINTYLQNQGGF